MKEYFENVETTTLITGIGIGMAVCLLIPPIYKYLKTWCASSDNKLIGDNMSQSGQSSLNSGTEMDLNETSSISDNVESNDNMSENQTSDLQSVHDTVSSAHSTTTLDTSSQLSQEDISSTQADTDLDETLKNAEIPSDALILELSDILSLVSVDEQIQALAFILPFVKKLSKDSYDCMKEWWDNCYSGDLDPTLIIYMNDILYHMNTLLSQM